MPSMWPRLGRGIVATLVLVGTLGGAVGRGEEPARAAADRVAAPGDEYVRKEIEFVKTAFRAEYARAAELHDSRSLISALARRAGLSDPGPRTYALLVEAERLAVEDGLFARALALAEERALRFQTPTWSTRLKLLERMQVATALEVVEEGVTLADASFALAVNREEFDTAGEFLSLVAEHGNRERDREAAVRQYFAYVLGRRPGNRPRKPSDRDVIKMADEVLTHRRKPEYEALVAVNRREFADARRRQAALKTPAASQLGTLEAGEAGHYLCLDRSDWDAGLHYLEQAGGALAEAARRERLARRSERPEKLAAVADEWWRLAEEIERRADGNRSDAASMQAHAATLYLETASKLDDPLERQVARKRIVGTPAPRILRGIEHDASSCPSAGDAARVYEAYLAQPRLSEAERRAAAVRLACWQARAEDRFTSHGRRWISGQEHEELVARCDKRLTHGMELLRLGSKDLAKEELDEASRLDPASPVADFVIGYVYSLFADTALLAAEHFLEASRRSPGNAYILTNLANTELDVGRHADALRHFEMALEHMADPMIANNIGFALQVGKRAGMSESVEAGFSRLYQRARADLGMAAKSLDALVFFRPAEAVTVPADKPRRNPAQDREANVTRVASGTGFVVAPGYVLTNRHVVADSTEIVVVDPADREKRIAATVVVASEEPDLAVLRCTGLPNQPAPLARVAAPRGDDVMTLGFPQSSLLGLELTPARGTVVAAATPERGEIFLHDCIVEPGYSGGPVLDRFGRVAGLALALVRVHEGGSSYGTGIPADAVMKFLDENLPPEVKPLPSQSSLPGDDGARAKAEAGVQPALSWSEVDARGGRSTVFIMATTRRGPSATASPAQPVRP